MDIFYPIKLFADWATFSVLKLSPNNLWGESINFFIYDTIKILALLYFIILAVSVIRTYVPQEKIKKILSKKNKLTGHFLASALGIITPFCSCSAVPLFLGFVEAGVPLGITFSFLVASPMINEIALAMLWGMFGIKIAIVYVMSGMAIAILSGVIIEKMKVEHLLKDATLQDEKQNLMNGNIRVSLKRRINYAQAYTTQLLKKIWIYVIIGIGLGAWIHGYVPSEFLMKYVGPEKWYAVPLATLIGIPLYSNAAGVIPIINSLFEKGIGLGTALAFMMAVTALSLPEFLILKRVMKTKLILIFATIVGTGIIFTGYLFNLI